MEMEMEMEMEKDKSGAGDTSPAEENLKNSGG